MDRNLRWMFAVLGIFSIGTFYLVLRSEYTQEWEKYQREFEFASQGIIGGIAKSKPKEIKQIVLDKFKRIDRCMTCHLGINNVKFECSEQPFKSHSGQYLVWHPIEKYGCTICHEGQGLATNYEDAAHNQIPHWVNTMIPAGLTQISCGKCHLDKTVPYASLLSDGRKALERYGCYGCHEVQRYSEKLKPALSLDRLGDKVERKWLVKWLKNPGDYLEKAKMPRFSLSQDEIVALTEFLLSSRDKGGLNIVEGEGDYDRGRGLFRQSRCISCHSINGKGGALAPELGNIASKVKKEWLLLYLKDVRHYQPRIKMLQYNFTEQEILDITEYMMGEFYSEDDATEDEDAVGEEEEDVEGEPIETNVSESALKELIRNGKEIFIKYGCFGCHDRTGVEMQAKVGPELKAIGSKAKEQLEFGNVEDVKRSIENYIFLKIKDTRLFDDNAKMPQFNLSDEDLINLTFALLSYTKEEIPLNYRVTAKRKTKFNPQGQFGLLFRKYRCYSCHEVFGSGGELSTAPLDMTGSQLKKEWLLEYLKKPYAVRPNVIPRMPRFRMTNDEAMYMTDYISAVFVDDSIPDDFERHFLPDDIDKGKNLFEEKGCISCHILGKGGGYVGPQLNAVGDRLKSGWIFKWLLNPQLYKPDTIEPNHGFSEDEARALSAYLSSMKQVDKSP
ncbi:MAG: c-type cytochrome [Candidatus Scalinduaceae bacterium]